MIAYRFGYDITTDLHHGVTIVWGKRRKRMLAFHWNWPHVVWFNRSWAVDERGYIQGLPVYRVKRKRWLLRGIIWPRHFKWVSDCAKERRPFVRKRNID